MTSSQFVLVVSPDAHCEMRNRDKILGDEGEQQRNPHFSTRNGAEALRGIGRNQGCFNPEYPKLSARHSLKTPNPQSRRGARGEEEQLELFFVTWCLKESYLKATGIGMGIDLGRIEFGISSKAFQKARGSHGRLVQDAACMFIDGRSMQGWSFELCFIDSHHVAAVASGPHSHAYKDSPDWPHVDPPIIADTENEARDEQIVMRVLEVEELLSGAARQAYCTGSGGREESSFLY